MGSYLRLDELPSSSSLYEAALPDCLFDITCLLLALWPDTPEGLMFGVFMTSVFSARIVVEFCKTPGGI